MAKSVTSDKIALTNVRISYAKLSKPEQFNGQGKAKFSATFLLDPANAEHLKQIQAIKVAAKKIALEAYNGTVPTGLPLCFGDGNKLAEKPGGIPDGYKDMFYIRTSSDIRPAVANRSRNVVAEGDKEFPYSGCYVNTNVTMWAQNNQFGKKINGNLRAVQFVKDGPAFGQAPPNIDDEFDVMDDNSPAAASDEFDDFA